MGGKFEGCTAYIYNIEGEMLASTKIYGHDNKENSIEVSASQALKDIQKCELLIISSPAPYACSGVIHPDGPNLTITLFKGLEREKRRSTRFNLSGKVFITALVCDGKAYALHTAIEAEMMNISTGGVRFKARYNTLSMGDIFAIRINMGGSAKDLIAKVVNYRNNECEGSEYGCAFLGGSNE